MLGSDLLKGIEIDGGNAARERVILDQSLMDHLRNGRGFWPVVTVDGRPQVVRFSTRDSLSLKSSGLFSSSRRGVDLERWTPETGMIDLVPLHALPVSDWPRVRMG